MIFQNSTEISETGEIGTNELLGSVPWAIEPAMKKLFSGEIRKRGNSAFMGWQSGEQNYRFYSGKTKL